MLLDDEVLENLLKCYLMPTMTMTCLNVNMQQKFKVLTTNLMFYIMKNVK